MNAPQQIYIPGQAMEGGFFAGIILIDGAQYATIVAPKAQGETVGPWGEYGKKIPANHFADGLANTIAMAEHGSYIAKWALDLDINGHQDWYIPSRDELELIYRNLKPTTDENYCSYRDGENPSSVPQGGLYEDNSPAQTQAPNFQEGAEESLDSIWHWSSTQYSAYSAFVQTFSDGYQLSDHKGNKHRVRAVRRFIIH